MSKNMQNISWQNYAKHLHCFAMTSKVFLCIFIREKHKDGIALHGTVDTLLNSQVPRQRWANTVFVTEYYTFVFKYFWSKVIRRAFNTNIFAHMWSETVWQPDYHFRKYHRKDFSDGKTKEISKNNNFWIGYISGMVWSIWDLNVCIQLLFFWNTGWSMIKNNWRLPFFAWEIIKYSYTFRKEKSHKTSIGCRNDDELWMGKIWKWIPLGESENVWFMNCMQSRSIDKCKQLRPIKNCIQLYNTKLNQERGNHFLLSINLWNSARLSFPSLLASNLWKQIVELLKILEERLLGKPAQSVPVWGSLRPDS